MYTVILKAMDFVKIYIRIYLTFLLNIITVVEIIKIAEVAKMI